jgi:hypothetical protein
MTKTPSEYLAALPADRKKALTKLRSTIRKALPKGYKETFNWGMITYEVPLKTYPSTYNKQPLMLAAIASQKNHLGLYLMCTYMDKKSEAALKDAYKKSGLKWNLMGKACFRFQSIDELPLPAIGKVIASWPLKKFIAQYEESRK